MNDAPDTMMRRLAVVVVGSPRVVLTALGALTLYFAIGVSQLHVEVDPDRQLPQDHPYIQALNDTHRLFGDKNLVVIGLHPHDNNPFTPATLAKVKTITDRLAELPGAVPTLLHSIASPTIKEVQHNSTGLTVRPLMPEVPSSAAAAEELRARVFDDPSYVDTLVSRDGSALAIYATFELTPQLPGYVNLHRAIEALLQQADDGTFGYTLSGVVVVTAQLSHYASQVAFLFPLAFLVIGLVHYDAFRTWQAVFLPLLTGLLAVVWALGLMGHLRVALDPFNSTTPVLILAVGAGHAVQILKRYYEELATHNDNDRAIIESIARVGPVMIAAATIAALSFFSLATLGTDSMRVFGTFTGLGILSALVIEMTAIPALRAILYLPQRRWDDDALIHPRLDRALRYLGTTLSKVRTARFVLVGYLFIALASCLLARSIRIDTSLIRNFAPDDPVRLQDETLNQRFAGTNSLLFIIEGPQEEALADPDAVRGIARFQQRFETLPGVGKTTSVVDTLKRLHRALNAGPPGHDGLPDRKETISQYLFLYTLSGGNDLSSRITPDNRTTKVVAMLHEDSTRYGEQIIERAAQIAREELPPGFSFRVAGTLASNAALTEAMVRGKILNVLQITFITIAVASLILRSLVGGLLVATPLTLAVLVNFGMMGILGIRLDITTAAVTAMAVGIGADYAVYFLFRVREGFAESHQLAPAISEALATSGKAIIFVSSAVALGYSVLCLSGFRVFVHLGALVGLAMVISTLATIVALPAMLTLLSRTRWVDGLLGRRADHSLAG